MAFFKNRKQTFDDAGDELLEKINGRMIKYAVERTVSDGEIILGKGGRIIVNEKEIVIMCDGREVFCCERESSKCGELLNLEGVRIQGEHEGKSKVVVVYYTYYRK